MYHSKKIALFISHIYGEYQKNVCQGVVDCAREYGFRTEIYTTSDGEDLGKYNLGEASVLEIPVFSEYSGVIIASDTYPEQALKDQILSALKENCTCPVIEISEHPSFFPTIALENNLTAGSLTEHLICTHGLERICYLGCSKEAFFSFKREQAYRNTMQKHGLSVPLSGVISCDYSLPEIQDALETMSKEATPQAIVCYNDRMALLLITAALKKGLQIPRDLAVTGCDETSEGKHSVPPLTTVTFPTRQMGITAVRQLISLLRKEPVPERTVISAQTVIGGSCGCSCCAPENPVLYNYTMKYHIQGLEASILTSMRMTAELSHAGDIEEGMDILEKYIAGIPGCQEFYLCLYPAWDLPPRQIQELTNSCIEIESENNAILLKLAVKNRKRFPECTFSGKNLLPDYLYKNSSHALIVTPLFFEDKAFGYLILSFEDNKIEYPFQLVHWIMNITQLLKNLQEQKGASLMRHELESIYTRDSLTGLLNHHGLKYHLPAFLQQKESQDIISVLLFDADCLKEINDGYGRQEGDLALKTIGEILRKAAMENRKKTLCVRLREDQFFLLLIGDEQECRLPLTRIERYFRNYNALSRRPYTLSVTSSFVSAQADGCHSIKDIQELILKADTAMHKKKNADNIWYK